MAVGKRLADNERNPQPSDGRERTRAQVGMRSALDSEAMPLDLMLIIMRGCPEADAITDLQFAAALAAAPFLHAKLTTICEASCWLNSERRTFAMLTGRETNTRNDSDIAGTCPMWLRRNRSRPKRPKTDPLQLAIQMGFVTGR
jgi:hypothetical protein